MVKNKSTKSSLSNKLMILKYGVEKYLIKNFKIFVPSSAGDYKAVGKETLKAGNSAFFLLKKLYENNFESVEIITAKSFCLKKKSIRNSIILKNLFNKFKSDKSKVHNYHLIYSALFRNRNNVKNILEIGIGTNNTKVISNMGPSGSPGASLWAFRDYFKFANVYGADIDKGILFNEKRIKTYFVDQTKIKTINSLYSKINKKFDLIIDDGLHAIHANLNTVIASLEMLNKNGWIIVEDIPLVALDVWLVASQLFSSKYKIYVIRSKQTVVFLIQKKSL